MRSYNHAKQIKESQDQYCAHVQAGNWDALAGNPYPEDLQWESLVDVLRGRVKVCTKKNQFELEFHVPGASGANTLLRDRGHR